MIKFNNKISDFLYYKNVKCDLHYCSIAKARRLDHSLDFVSIKPCFMIDIEFFFLIVHKDFEFFFLLFVEVTSFSSFFVVATISIYSLVVFYFVFCFFLLRFFFSFDSFLSS